MNPNKCVDINFANIPSQIHVSKVSISYRYLHESELVAEPVGHSKLLAPSIFLMLTECDAGDDGGDCRTRNVRFKTGIRRQPGVITIGLPFISSAYLKPTATASGRFRYVPVSYETFPLPDDAAWGISRAAELGCSQQPPPGNKPSEPQHETLKEARNIINWNEKFLNTDVYRADCPIWKVQTYLVVSIRKGS